MICITRIICRPPLIRARNGLLNNLGRRKWCILWICLIYWRMRRWMIIHLRMSMYCCVIRLCIITLKRWSNKSQPKIMVLIINWISLAWLRILIEWILIFTSSITLIYCYKNYSYNNDSYDDIKWMILLLLFNYSIRDVFIHLGNKLLKIIF